MARKKQQKKRLKKYQGKYVTADRLDMSKGGRVQKAVGGRPQLSKNWRIDQDQRVATPEKKPTPKPMQPVRKPITQEPQKPVQPGILVGMFGYAIATFIGIALAGILGA